MSMMEAVERRILLSQSWFVSPGGSNANPGTLNAPLQTIQAAANLAQPGDTVMIETGTYHETVTPPRSGTAAAPITFEAYNTEQVVISGADPVAGWNQYSGSIYDAPMSWDLGAGNNQVFVDGQMINEARYPNTSLDVSHPTRAVVSSATTTSPDDGWLVPSTATLYDPSLTAPAGAWVGATIHIGNGQDWVVQTGTVLSSSVGSLTFSFEHLTSYELPTAGNTYYLTGSFKALDAAGEWYRDPTSGLLYLWTPAGDTPAAHDIEVKHRLYAFELSGKSYINIQGVSLFSATIDSDSSSNYLTISSIFAEYVSSSTLNPVPWDSHNTNTNQGLQLNGSHDLLQNSTVAFSSANGVYVGGIDDTVQNCVIHDVDYAGSDAAGIELGGTGQQILGNTIYYAGRSGITASYSTADTIDSNIIHDVGLQTTDLGGIYAWGTDGLGTTIAYNTIYNITTGGFGGGGAYLDNGAADYVVHDNTIYNVDHPLKGNGPLTNDAFYNNTVTGGTNELAPESTPASGTGNGVTDLGSFGGFNSEAEAINAGGQIVGVSSTGAADDAFLYSSGSTSSLGTLGGKYGIASAINSAGTVVGAAYTSAGPRQAFVDASGVMNNLGTLPGDVSSEANGINSSGQVVGLSYNEAGEGHAFSWLNGVMQAIPTLGGSINVAFGINDSGWIVGASTIPGDLNANAFVYRNGNLTDLGTLGGSSSYALGVSNSGEIVGESRVAGDGATHAFAYLNGTMTDLGTLPGLPNSVATGVNDNGDVVGYAYNLATFSQHAFLYHNGVMTDLNSVVPTNGWIFTLASGINDNGQIVGGGTNPSGYSRAFTVTEAQSAGSATSIYSSASAPAAAQQNVSDPTIPGSGGVELGVKFRSDVSGYITGVRFYKGSQNTGTHTGELWSNSGQLLTTATFSNESASGWQQVTFSSPVAITANTTYIVAYHTSAPYISYSAEALATTGVDNAPLHALANGVDGSDGVYHYGPSSFPSLSNGQAPSYWVDVVFSTSVSTPATPAAPLGLMVTATTSSSVSLTWAASSGASSYTVLRAASGTTSYAQVGTSSSTTFTDSTAVPSTAYLYEVTASNTAGSSPASATVTATTLPASTSSAVTIWNSSATPATSMQNVNDPSIPGASGVELGLKFRSDVAGTVTGVRFWKGTLNTGAHTGELWSSTGQLLATATFTNESASGWQQVSFSTPVTISANTTYVVSYHTNAAYLAYGPGTFAGAGVDNTPLHALANGVDGNNGVYHYGASSFPSLYNGQAPSYWVDVAFTPLAITASTLFAASAAPAANQQNVSDPSIPGAGGVELGTKFRSSVAGTVTAVRFWKGTLDTGVHTGELWSSTGQLLATATFTSESATGWQQVNFSTPVSIAANTTYIVSYHTTAAYIAYTPGTFGSGGIVSGPLIALANGVDGNNGVYAYGASSFPSLHNGQSPNYWADVVFTPAE